jgi:aspartyl protease family protein
VPGTVAEADVGLWIGVLFLALAGVALMLRHDQGDIFGLELYQFAALTTGIALFVFLASSLLGSYRGRIGQAVKDVTAWVVIALALVGVYSFKDELTNVAYRLAGELSPPGNAIAVETAPAGERAVRIRRRMDGHFGANVTIDGTSISMLVDTGASTVVLKQADAKKLGIDVAGLTYSVPVQTANGMAYAAPVRLRNLSVGPIVIPQVEALVAQTGTLKESLLGMTFLSRLRSYEFSGDFLTLRS